MVDMSGGSRRTEEFSVAADLRQRGSRSRGGFGYQDRCIAVGILRGMIAGSLVAADVELATDAVIWTTNDPPEYVSVKGREPDQKGDTGWTWAAINGQGLLADLFRHWDAGGRQGTTTVWSNAGLQGPATQLRDLPSDPEAISAPLAERVAGQLHTDLPSARDFLVSLRWPRRPMPRAADIDAVIDDLVSTLLKQHDRSREEAIAARERLLDVIAERSERDPRHYHHATEAAAHQDAENDLRKTRRLTAAAIRDVVLAGADEASAPSRRTVRLARDPLFTGRRPLLDELREWARFGEAVAVRSMVLTGPIGVGKSSVAFQFAAESPEARVTLLDGASALSLAASAQDNLGLSPAPADPLAPLLLPGGPADLVIIDGVTDAAVVAPYLAGESMTRVLVTSTATDVSRRCRSLTVDEWSEGDATEFIREAHPRFTTADTRALAAALGHNPLAISQAVAVCQHLELDVPAYLERLDREPESVLDLGVDALRPRSLVAALRLGLETLDDRVPEARPVLEFLCCLGSTPVPQDFVGSSTMVMILDGHDEVEDRTPIESSLRLSRLLGAPAERNRVIYGLRTASMIRIVDGAFVVHPVVRRLVLALAADLRAPLEVSLGHFDVHLSLSSDRGQPDALTDCTRGAELIELCLSTGQVGPACYAACLTFAPWLASLGEMEKAVRLAEIGRGWTERRRPGMPGTYAVAEDLMYLEALVGTGQLNLAAVLLPDVHTAALHEGMSRQAAEALLLLARVAGAANDRRAWSYVAEYLPGGDLDALPRATRLDILLTHAHVAWQEGDFARARRTVDEMLRLTGSEPSDTDSGWRVEALLFDAALARFETDGEGRSPAALARVQQFDQEAGQASRVVITVSHAGALLDAVDALIDDDEIGRAEEFMDRAAAAITGRLADNPALRNERASIEGRLALHQHLRDRHAPGAVSHLERARSLLRQAALGYRGEQARRQLPAVLVNLSTVEHHLNLHAQAVASAGEAVQVDLDLFGPDHPETVRDVKWWRFLQQREAQLKRLGGTG